MKDLLTDFFTAIASDPRIGNGHISVYCALLQLATDNPAEPILFKSSELMRFSKIGGSGTYHRTIRDLHQFGYIDYTPSYNFRQKNKAYLLEVKK